MMDAGHEAAERALDEFEREAARLYEDAAKEAGEPIAEWLERFKDADEAMAALVEDGEATPDEYAQWRYVAFAAGRDEAIAEAADRLAAANVAAMGVLAGLLAPVFIENSDYAAWMVEREAGQIGFRLCDEDHFSAIVEREEPLFARAEIDEGRDAAWNRKMITARVTAAVLSCKPIEDIERLSAGFASTNRGSASRIARTAVTGVQNAARVERFEQAGEMGIALKQEWLATVDSRTRHSHRELDGERAEVGKAFSNGLRYPGDPTGPGHEIWNCRCTLIAAVEGHTTEDGRRFTRYDGTYEEWKSEKAASRKSVGASVLREDDFPEIRLASKEYAATVSAINNSYHAKHEGHAISAEQVDQEDGAYEYVFIVNGFGEYRIIERNKIE